MNKPTEYESRRDATAQVAVEKAQFKPNKESTWTFEYRNRPVAVTARKDGGKFRLSTQHVRNHGK